MSFAEELDRILETDPLGLLKQRPKASNAVSSDERLISSFQEICDFVSKHNREPQESTDINERKLFSRLKGIRENPDKIEALTEHDAQGILPEIITPEPKEIKTIDDVLGDDALGLLGDSPEGDTNPDNILILKNVPKSQKKPDLVAKRKKCDEFEKFEPLFKKIHAELASGTKTLKPFTSERQIEPGTYFVAQGQIVYVANLGKWEKRNFRNVDARLYCVFENGTESNLLLRSLAATLWRDENSRQVVDKDHDKAPPQAEQINLDDKSTGNIYILSSLSEKPKIQEIQNLYKIGFSTQPVAQRIQNAEQDPTYLMAKVEVVAEFETFNLNPQKLEHLLHRFFANSCVALDVHDQDGKRHTPREWFIAPLHMIKQAIALLINGEITGYSYDPKLEQIVPKDA